GDLNSAAGKITVSGAFGDFNIQASFATSNSAGGGQPALLTSNDTSISSNGFVGDRTLKINVQDDGFTAPSPGPAVMGSQLSATGLPTDSTVTFQSSLNGAPGTLLTSPVPSPNPGPTASDPVTIPSSPYTLSNTTTIAFHGHGAGTTLTVNTTG